jgi:cell division transport system permease protein
MAFLAALALGASLVATRAAEGWQSGLADRITVQIMPPEVGDNPAAAVEAETRTVVRVLNATPGIAHAKRLSDAQINALVEPWIGKDGVVAGIPLPRLVDATVTPGADVDIAKLTERSQTRRAQRHAGRSSPLDLTAARPWPMRCAGRLTAFCC